MMHPMDWSEILTQSEGEYMQRLLERLGSAGWAGPLLSAIDAAGGIKYANKPLLFEARVGHALQQAGAAGLEYEFAAGVSGSTVDYRFGSAPVWLTEVVSIGRSAAVEAATFRADPFYGTLLSSPDPSQPEESWRQSEEGEALLVIQKIGEKVHDGTRPVKFPRPAPGQYHAVIVDMRGHLGGGDIEDWKQIAYGAHVVAPEYKKFWPGKDGKPIPVLGVWHPQNPMRFAATARERLHAIMFVAEERYEDGALTESCWICFNPNLFENEAEALKARDHFPLRPPAAPA